MLLLPETITVHAIQDTLRMMAQVPQQEDGDMIVVNAGTLKEFDSAALAVLLECKRFAQARGKRFMVKEAPSKLSNLAKLYGVDDLLSLTPDT